MKLAALLLVVLSLVGCAAAPPLDTPSGLPEITIQNVVPKQVLDRIASAVVSHGMQITASSDYGITAAKELTSGTAFMMLASSQANPVARLSYSVVSAPGGVRVFLHAATVANPVNPHEQVYDVTAAQGPALQQQLENLKASFR
jgi:hypothetical protein